MGTYQPLTESLREVNRLMLDTQKWNAEREERQQQWGLQKMKFEEDKKNNELHRQLQQEKLAEVQEAMTPREVNVYDFFHNTPENRTMIFHDTSGANDLGSVFGPGVRPGEADGIFRNEKGEPIKLTKPQLQRAMPLLMSHLERYNDPAEFLTKQANAANDELAAVEQEWKNVSKTDPRFMNKRAELEIKRNGIVSRLNEFNTAMGPESLIKEYKDQYQRQYQLLMAGLNYGLDPSALAVMGKNLEYTQERIKNTETEMLKGGNSVGASLKLARNKNTGQAVYLSVKKIANGMLPSTLDPTLRAEDGWIWDEEYNDIGKNLPSNQWDTCSRMLSARVGTENPNNPGTYIVPEQKQDLNRAMQKQLEMLIKSNPRGNSLEIVNAADTDARADVTNYFKQLDSARVLGSQSGTKDEDNPAIKFAKEKFYSVYGFIPEKNPLMGESDD